MTAVSLASQSSLRQALWQVCLIDTLIVIPLIELPLSGAFSGLLATAIVHMEGIGGKRGWAWIFILVSLPNDFRRTGI